MGCVTHVACEQHTCCDGPRDERIHRASARRRGRRACTDAPHRPTTHAPPTCPTQLRRNACQHRSRLPNRSMRQYPRNTAEKRQHLASTTPQSALTSRVVAHPTRADGGGRKQSRERNRARGRRFREPQFLMSALRAAGNRPGCRACPAPARALPASDRRSRAATTV